MYSCYQFTETDFNVDVAGTDGWLLLIAIH
jgi:hypothetical protein